MAVIDGWIVHANRRSVCPGSRNKTMNAKTNTTITAAATTRVNGRIRSSRTSVELTAVTVARLSWVRGHIRARPRGRLRRPRALHPPVRGARGSGRDHPDRSRGRVRVRLLEARRDVRQAEPRRRAPPLRRDHDTARALPPGDDHV